ncbi:hypothetical protein OESDEN_17994 [Oesophagostomum dentatum]|uniref:Uncharacterized protein n=1 Tax=Oesophagostomum dentatum TaxID=61180 RepID=A0A0B1SAI2_OESDE|nr:hypothetical protein OESDEN_17994 [Oesophagostomum dentatum]
MDYARYLNDNVDRECPDFCGKFVKTILSDNALRFDASNKEKMMAWYTNVMFDYCDKYDYKGDAGNA